MVRMEVRRRPLKRKVYVPEPKALKPINCIHRD